MVTQRTDLDTGESTFSIRPNCSLSWAGMKVALGALLASLTGVAVYFIAIGAWLVAPFTGLEALALAVGMYLSSRHAASREIIQIREDSVFIYRGRKTLREAARFPRSWARVKLSQDPKRWYPSKLLISSHGRMLELGKDLTEVERIQLAIDIKKMISFQPAYKPVLPSGCLNELDTAGQQV